MVVHRDAERVTASSDPRPVCPGRCSQPRSARPNLSRALSFARIFAAPTWPGQPALSSTFPHPTITHNCRDQPGVARPARRALPLWRWDKCLCSSRYHDPLTSGGGGLSPTTIRVKEELSAQRELAASGHTVGQACAFAFYLASTNGSSVVILDFSGFGFSCVSAR
jgi:hypothetical protein